MSRLILGFVLSNEELAFVGLLCMSLPIYDNVIARSVATWQSRATSV
jgi:hypothetical protein